MSNRADQHQPISPLASALRHPLLVGLLLTLGLVLGLLAAFVLPRTAHAEARVAVVPANTNAYNVAGYSQGSRDLAADYARWVQNQTAAGGDTGAEVTASPIPESSVVRIEASAATAEAATAAAKKATDTLVAGVKEAQAERDPQAAYKAYTDMSPTVAAARARAHEAEAAYNRAIGGKASAATLNAARTAYEKAQSELSQLELKQDAAGALYQRVYVDTQGNSTLKVVAPAASTGDGARSSLLRYGLLGLGIGALAGLLAAVFADRRRGHHVATATVPSTGRGPVPGSDGAHEDRSARPGRPSRRVGSAQTEA